MSQYPRHCVMIPFFNRHEQVAKCVTALVDQAKQNTFFLLIDDGSTPKALQSPDLQLVLKNKNVYLISHQENYGVSAARNSGFDWCRKNNIEIVIMIDSDCVPEENFIDEHLKLHQLHAEAAAIGGRIEGVGDGLWALLDGAASWIHSSAHVANNPDGEEFRLVKHPFHLATTNFSIKLNQMPNREFVFDERLITGEDCFLIRELRRNKKNVFFSSVPKIYHQDREHWRNVFSHHYEWGHHQYFIQLGGDLSPRCFHPLYRFLFVLGFSPLLPLFALIGASLNCRSLWANQRSRLLLFPLIYLLWLAKGLAVLEAAICPYSCLRKNRKSMQYEVASQN